MIWTIDVMAYYLLEAGMPEHEAITALSCAWTLTKGDEEYYRPSSSDNALRRGGVYAIPLVIREDELNLPGPQMARDARSLRRLASLCEGGAAEWYGNLAAVPGYVFDAARAGVKNPIAGYEPGQAPATFAQRIVNADGIGYTNIPFIGME